jgi:transcriptional regulator with XRE-family HTH domain
MNSGDRIKELRTSNKMTQEELAEKLGLQKSAIAKYENGRVENIKRSTLEKMANIFNVSPAYIMGLSDIKDIDSMSLSSISDELLPSFIQVIKKMENNDDLNKDDLYIYLSGFEEMISDITEKIRDLNNNHTFNKTETYHDPNEKDIINYYKTLNEKGRSEAVKRVKELTFIPLYTDNNSSDKL